MASMMASMMASLCRRTGSVTMLYFLLAVFLLRPEGGVSLELQPSASEVLLDPNSSYSVVCSGWSQVTWRVPPDSGVQVVPSGSSSSLQLVNVTWKNSGRFTCEEASSDQSRHVDVFVPGRGPAEWFVPVSEAVVMRETEEDTIPCAVSDPRLDVSLYERPSRTRVQHLPYEAARGFTGRLNDSSYVCEATRGAERVESQVFYVFSVVVRQQLEVDLSASSLVLKQGESLVVNCTVTDTEMVFFSWDFPRRQDTEPLMDFLPGRIRSFINITSVTVADSGVYVCGVQETVGGRTVEKNLTVTVLDRGYVLVWPSGDTNVTSVLHHTVQLSVEVDAHPAPSVLWTRDNRTVAMETTSITNTHLTGSRYVSTLTLVRVSVDQTGSYKATVSNDDGVDEVEFSLDVRAPPRISSLSELSAEAVVCVCEGAPPPSVAWYTCPSSHRCSSVSGGWRSLSAAEFVSVQENVTELETGVTQVRSVLTLRALSSLSAVRCQVTNSAGGRARDLRVVPAPLLSQVVVLASVLVLVVVAVVFLVVLIVLWRKKPRYEGRWKLIRSEGPDGRQCYLDPALLPYASTWEVPRDHVVLGPVLGSGAFGRVVEASVSGLVHSNSTTKAAVKMVKRRADAVQSLMSELKVLVHLGPHLNVVNLLGACTRGGPVYLITEFCRHGDLVTYLQKNKHMILQSDMNNQSDGGYMDMATGGVQYVAMQQLGPAHIGPAHTGPAHIEPDVYEAPCAAADQQEAPALLSDSALLSSHDLLSFSFQVCQAMDFLSSRKCVHRDLAARNVLVCEGRLVKVCDFGLARDLLKDQDYVSRGNSFLPLRWMAPESITQNVYSQKSDVWSYGVLLWEVFSLGCRPYPDLPMTQQFVSALRRGHRMSRPERCPQDIYDLMKLCWETKPESRPSFSSLVVTIGTMMSHEFKQRYLQLTENFLNGGNPAVIRSRLNSSRPEDHGSSPQVELHLSEAESKMAASSHGSHIIAVTDVTVETCSGAVLDAVSLQREPQEGQEVTSQTNMAAAELPAASGRQQEP